MKDVFEPNGTIKEKSPPCGCIKDTAIMIIRTEVSSFVLVMVERDMITPVFDQVFPSPPNKVL